MALRLASAGYGGGDPERIMKMRADWVVRALQYENFKAEYEDAYVEMNRKER